jgi:hypothetical protein
MKWNIQTSNCRLLVEESVGRDEVGVATVTSAQRKVPQGIGLGAFVNSLEPRFSFWQFSSGKIYVGQFAIAVKPIMAVRRRYRRQSFPLLTFRGK